jgi:vacuolar protein sorting-associated protein 13A/C
LLKFGTEDTVFSEDNYPIIVGVSESFAPEWKDCHGLFCPMTYSVSSQGTDIETPVITVWPALFLRNELAQSVYLHPQTEFPQREQHRFAPGETGEITRVNRTRDFYLSFGDHRELLLLSMQGPCRHTLRTQRAVYLDVCCENYGKGLLLSVRRAVMPQPIMVLNGFEHPICAVLDPRDISKRELQVAPQCATFLASDKFADYNSIFVILDKPYEIDLGVTPPPSPPGPFTYEVRQLANNCKLVILSASQVKKEQTQKLSIVAKMNRIEVSFIDDTWRELALLSFGKGDLQFSRHSGNDLFSLQIGSVQLDDQYPEVPIPVCMFSDKSKRFLSMIFQSSSEAPFMSCFAAFDLRVAPLTLFIDKNFLSDFLTFFTTLSGPAASPELAVRPSRHVTIGTLVLGTVLLSVTVRRKTGRRLSHPFSPFIPWFIVPVTDGRIHLEGRELHNISSPLNSISAKLLDAYFKELRLEAARVFGRTDLLGLGAVVPRAIENLSAGVTSVSAGKMPRYEPMVLPSIAGALRTAADFVQPADEGHKRAAGVNQSVGQTLGEAMCSLGSGIKSGFTGVVMEPIAAHRREGALGLIKGIGTGIAGLVRRPLGGVLDAAAGIVSSAQKAVASGEIVGRMRNPRVLPFAQVTPFDQEMADAQAAFHRGFPDSRADMFVFCLRLDKEGVLAITTECLVVFADRQTIRDVHQLGNITEATTHRTRLTVRLTKTEQKFTVVCQSVDDAKTAKQVLGRAIMSKQYTTT